ncbi:MAG TPA: hypothetical protein VH373_09980 [Jatrophihabitantaceae bacterium]
MIIAGIVTCEIAFWVFLAAGLAVRYLLRRPQPSRYVLLGSPLADLGLLVLSAVDLARGAKASEAHALAAAYISFTVVFGPSVIRWADARFAHRFAGGPAPRKVPKRGSERVRHEWREFGKAVLACAMASALIGLGVLMVGDSGRSQALVGFETRLAGLLVIWFVVGPLWDTMWLKRQPR